MESLPSPHALNFTRRLNNLASYVGIDTDIRSVRCSSAKLNLILGLNINKSSATSFCSLGQHDHGSIHHWPYRIVHRFAYPVNVDDAILSQDFQPIFL